MLNLIPAIVLLLMHGSWSQGSCATQALLRANLEAHSSAPGSVEAVDSEASKLIRHILRIRSTRFASSPSFSLALLTVFMAREAVIDTTTESLPETTISIGAPSSLGQPSAAFSRSARSRDGPLTA